MHQDTVSDCGSHATNQDITGWAECAGYDFSMQNIADSHHWMAVTIIEDDDLMFDNKPLCTWYEEGRRRYSSGDNDSVVPSPSSSVEDEEELHRGRQRVRRHLWSYFSARHCCCLTGQQADTEAGPSAVPEAIAQTAQNSEQFQERRPEQALRAHITRPSIFSPAALHSPFFAFHAGHPRTSHRKGAQSLSYMSGLVGDPSPCSC